MTMTLGLEFHGYVRWSRGDVALADEVLAAVARHLPGGGALRFLRERGPADELLEVDAAGVRPVSDAERLRAAIRAAGSYHVWPNDEAPLGIEPVILPGPGWDVAALCAEPALVRAQLGADHFADGRRALPFFGERCAPLLDLAEAERFVLVFR